MNHFGFTASLDEGHAVKWCNSSGAVAHYLHNSVQFGPMSVTHRVIYRNLKLGGCRPRNILGGCRLSQSSTLHPSNIKK